MVGVRKVDTTNTPHYFSTGTSPCLRSIPWYSDLSHVQCKRAANKHSFPCWMTPMDEPPVFCTRSSRKMSCARLQCKITVYGYGFAPIVWLLSKGSLKPAALRVGIRRDVVPDRTAATRRGMCGVTSTNWLNPQLHTQQCSHQRSNPQLLAHPTIHPVVCRASHPAVYIPSAERPSDTPVVCRAW